MEKGKYKIQRIKSKFYKVYVSDNLGINFFLGFTLLLQFLPS